MIVSPALALFTALAGAMPCEGLRSLTVPHTVITANELVPAGPYTVPAPPPPPGLPPGDAGRGPASPSPIVLPARCRVAAVLQPSPDSHIEMELWLPVDAWNGKFEAVGNGGWAGTISYAAMALALREGYATASTDTGHKGGTGEFALGHPEKVVDFGYRAVHEMTATAKAIIAAFYERGPRLSYFNGCSTGGRQALMEAQRYPDDFDGIVAGAPANSHIHLHTANMAKAIEIINDPARAVPPEKIAVLAQAVLDRCDALDGVRDGLVSNPLACRFDVTTLQCTGAETSTCLTAAQAASVERAYAPTLFKNGEAAWSGYAFGSESGWTRLGGGTAPAGLFLDTFRYLAHQNADWDWRSFDVDRDTALADKNAGFIDAVNPNLEKFAAHGAKLVMYHGWADPQIAPGHTIDYYSSVLSAMGGSQEYWLRLFMAPGMAHCRGGPGPDQINFMGALERWRESGTPPDRIIASRVTSGRVDMTRPLCPYPQVAQYSGVGSTNDADNFVCKMPSTSKESSPSAQTSPQNGWTVPRTPDGRPDLQGIWTNATITPFERPRELGAKEFYTEAEAADMKKRALVPAPTAERGGTEAHYEFTQFGLDRTQAQVAFSLRTSLIVGPEGRVPPLTPEAQARIAERAANAKGHEFDGPESRGIQERCLVWGNEGPPMLPPGYNSYLQIVQTPGYVVILQEMIHDARVIPLDGRPHAPQTLRRWQGDSRGHWDGDTLVVDTTNFTDKTNFRGSRENLHVVERFTRVDDDTIRYEFTVDDPTTWTKAWSAEMPLARDKGPIYEYACHEGNYGLPNNLSGARATDKAAEESGKKKP